MKKKTFLFTAFIVLTFTYGFLKAEQGDFATLGYNSPSGYSYWRVDSSGYFKPGVASTLDIGTAALPVRNIYAGGLVGATLTSATLTSPAITGPTITGSTSLSTATFSGGLRPYQVTLATLATITPSTTNQLVVCSDCGAVKLVISTGTTIDDWALVTSSSTYPS